MVCTTGFGFSLAVDCMVKLCKRLTIAVASGDSDHGCFLVLCCCCCGRGGRLTVDGCEYVRMVIMLLQRHHANKSVWSSGMIPALGAGGPGFKPRHGP